MTDHSNHRSNRELEREISREVAYIQANNEMILPAKRCRVCQHPESRTRVNTLLGYGMRDAEISSFVGDINEKRSKNNQITLNSIRNHRLHHFPVQSRTQAGYRRILERRKAQLSDEHEGAVTSLLTGQAYLDVVAQKGWQHLIDENTIVDFEIGLKAMLKLEEMQREGAIEEQIAQMRRDVGLLQQAVSDIAKQYPDLHLMDAISERIDELTGTGVKRSSEVEEPVDVEVVDFYDQDDEEEATPTFSSDEGDSIEES